MKILLMVVMFFGVSMGACCAGETTDLFPGDTKALDVFLQDKNTREEIEVGRVEAGWGFQRASLDSCKETAKEEAKKRRIADWDYYCCTVTKENNCVNKLKALH